MANAMDKLRDEMAAKHEDGMLCQLGELLCAYLQEAPSAEEALAADKKTIAGAVEAMTERARKKAVKHIGALTLPEGMEIALGYYGVEMDKAALSRAMYRMISGEPDEAAPAQEAPAAEDELDLDALLGGALG